MASGGIGLVVYSADILLDFIKHTNKQKKDN